VPSLDLLRGILLCPKVVGMFESEEAWQVRAGGTERARGYYIPRDSTRPGGWRELADLGKCVFQSPAEMIHDVRIGQ
jgi:hypothetical protein